MAEQSELERRFPLEELTFSETAARHAIPNEPDDASHHNIITVLRPGLYVIRQDILGAKPVNVSSAYRNADVNCLVGGSMTRESLQMLMERTHYDVVRDKAAQRLRMGYGRGYGQSDSGHMSGYCADVTCRSFGRVIEVCKAVEESDLNFDQLIYEFGGWMHISFAPAMRRHVMTILNDGQGYTFGLHERR